MLTWYNRHHQRLNLNDGSVWQYVKRFTKTYFKMPPLTTPTTIVYKNKEKAEAIADVLEKQFQTNDLSHPPTENIVRKRVKRFLRKKPEEEPEQCLPSEIIGYIDKLKIGKSPGFDNISNIIIKRMPIKSIIRLSEIINAMLKFQYFPNEWKTSIVVPLLKPGKHAKDPGSYRPISLLSALGKISESVLLKRIVEAKEDKLIPMQFGFRKNLSTVQQLLRITEIVKEGIDEGWETEAVFLTSLKRLAGSGQRACYTNLS
ncbi:putative RNA-directed DNA polymerase from transposon BS [Araneus ventricosus]|uniref:Putative RNA-directed DNA polymerase from transposon BS n=1 Tax=Araneus ventricosus TaxID=182803 RepID=A0A4Y2AP31_ARAVE|nr:putative RNA-directed DNA polymerase from transposon BS [Araneus ventricosus]